MISRIHVLGEPDFPGRLPAVLDEPVDCNLLERCRFDLPTYVGALHVHLDHFVGAFVTGAQLLDVGTQAFLIE